MFVATELTSHSTKETVSTAYLVSFKITFAFKYKYNLMCGDMTEEGWKILLHFHLFQMNTTIPTDSLRLLNLMSFLLLYGKYSFMNKTNHLDSI